MVGVRLLPLPQHLIHLSSQFAAPKPNLPILGSYRDTKVRLVVFSSCSSAAPTPMQEPYGMGAFDGLAQRIIGPDSAVRAVVAMQFDLESSAATAFSSTFYRKLLEPGRTLDEAVAQARLAIIVELGVGHRAWVTPTLYSRCRDGILFDVKEIRNNLNDDTRRLIVNIDTEIGRYREMIEEIAKQPPEIQQALTPSREEYQAKIEARTDQKNAILGNSVRLWGGRAKPGDVVSCRLTLKLLMPAAIRTVNMAIAFSKFLSFRGHRPGDVGGDLAVNIQPDFDGRNLRITVPNVSSGGRWQANEYELAILDFEVAARTTIPIATLKLSDVIVDADPPTSFSTLDGVVFVAESAKRAKAIAAAEAQVAKNGSDSWGALAKEVVDFSRRTALKVRKWAIGKLTP
jgi:CHAT domain